MAKYSVKMARKIRLQTAVNQSETAASLRGQGAPYRDWSVWQARSPHLVGQFVTRKSAEKNNGMLRERAFGHDGYVYIQRSEHEHYS